MREQKQLPLSKPGQWQGFKGLEGDFPAAANPERELRGGAGPLPQPTLRPWTTQSRPSFPLSFISFVDSKDKHRQIFAPEKYQRGIILGRKI